MKVKILGMVMVAVILMAGLAGCSGARVKDLELQNTQLRAQVEQLTVQADNLTAKIATLSGGLDEKDVSITELNGEIAKLQKAILKDPTCAELWEFISTDETNKRRDISLYSEFTRELLKRAAEWGIKGHVVVAHVNQKDYFYAGFYCVDKSDWVFIVAPTDGEEKLVDGKRWSELNNSPLPSYDDTIRLIIFP